MCGTLPGVIQWRVYCLYHWQQARQGVDQDGVAGQAHQTRQPLTREKITVQYSVALKVRLSPGNCITARETQTLAHRVMAVLLRVLANLNGVPRHDNCIVHGPLLINIIIGERCCPPPKNKLHF